MYICVLGMWILTTVFSQVVWTLTFAIGVRILWWHWEKRKTLALARRFNYGYRALPLIGHTYLIFKTLSIECKYFPTLVCLLLSNINSLNVKFIFHYLFNLCHFTICTWTQLYSKTITQKWTRLRHTKYKNIKKY